MITSRKILILFSALSLIFLTGCATSVEHYGAIDKCLKQGDYKQPVSILKKTREKGGYEQKDRVLYYLELGLANHYAGNYQTSNELLSRAEQSIRELFTKSVSNVGKSLLTNDNELPYRGEPYENIYINFFKALNYAHLDKRQAAKVEVRRIYEKLSDLERNYRQEASKYKETFSSSSLVSPETKETLADSAANLGNAEFNFHNSALGRYMNYTMYLSEHHWDDAEIDLRKLKEAFINQPGIYDFSPPKMLPPSRPPEGKAPVHALALLGQGPVKYQETIRLPLSKDVGQVKLALPNLKMRGTKIDRVDIFQGGQKIASLEKLENINRVSKTVFDMQRPLILFKTLLRVTVKEFATDKAADQASGNAALALAIFGEIYKEVSEQADLRTCRLLPGEVHVKSFYLPYGTNNLTARYYSKGQQINVSKITLQVKRKSLNLLELVNLN